MEPKRLTTGVEARKEVEVEAEEDQIQGGANTRGNRMSTSLTTYNIWKEASRRPLLFRVEGNSTKSTEEGSTTEATEGSTIDYRTEDRLEEY